ncbi:MAG: amidohydrolase, partial [Betaproteobacteria bacterium]|nr:amidohydrolase [Betaproteobacteria bacterium]
MAINTALDPAALELIDSIRSGKALSLFKPASDQPADEIAQSAYLARLLRQDIHQQPELAFEEHRTSAIVASMLRMWGYEVHEGVGRTGVVAVMHFVAKAKDPADLGPGFGFRADMDALPIQEQTGKAYASRRAGFMHACGHDGHTASLLGAARLIAQRKAQAACENWHGRLHLIFQPAEENGQDGGGAMAMVRDGLFERFPCEQIFGMHNAPTLGLGKVHLRPGPMMASSDRVDVLIEGKGGHAAFPHRSVDPTVAAASVVMALQSIVSRNVDPFANAVISIGKLIAGERGTHNVIPQQAIINNKYRSYGVEFEGGVDRGIFHLTAGATYTHARITESQVTPALNGNIPYRQAALIFQATPSIRTDRFDIGANVTGTTSSYAADVNKSASDIDRSTAYAKASQQCYQSAFTKLVADRKAKTV